MINMMEVAETNNMILKENLDVRTITMGISLLNCIDSDLEACKKKIYERIVNAAKDLVKTGEDISKEYGIPIVNKRISVTPIAIVGAACCKAPEDYVGIAHVLDKAAADVSTVSCCYYQSRYGLNHLFQQVLSYVVAIVAATPFYLFCCLQAAQQCCRQAVV